MALITPPPRGQNGGQPVLVPPHSRGSLASSTSSVKKRRRRTSHMASGIGPAVPASILDENVAWLNLHSNELRTLDVVPSAVPTSHTVGVAAYDSLVELDVSSNFLGEAYNNGYIQPAGGVQSLLRLAPNLQVLNLSANALTAESLSGLLGLAVDRVALHQQDPAACLLQHLTQLDLSHNSLRHLPDVLSASCPHLSSLNLVGNAIDDLPPLLRAVYPLKETLVALSLQAGDGQQREPGINPVCSSQGYRERLISALGSLSELDSTEVCPEDKAEARRVVELGLVYGNDDESSATSGQVAKAEANHRKVNSNPGHVRSSRGNLAGKRQRSKPTSSSLQAVESKFETALSRIDKQETRGRSHNLNYHQRPPLQHETGYGDDASSGQVSQGEAGLRASTDSLRKLNKLENRVKLLSDLAREQADATERLLRSNTAAAENGAIRGPCGQSAQQSTGRRSEQHLQVNERSHHNAPLGGKSQEGNVVRVADAAVQCSEVGNVRQQAHSKIRRSGDEPQGSKMTMLHIAVLQMTAVLSRSRDRALQSAFTCLTTFAVQTRHAEEILLAKSESKQRETEAIKRAVAREREAYDRNLHKSDDLVRELNVRLSEYEKDKIDMVRIHESNMQLAQRKIGECADDAEEEFTQHAFHVERLEQKVASANSEKIAARQQLGETRKELDDERERRSRLEDRCENFAAERDKAMEKAKEEALSFCDKELRRQQQHSHSKLLQVKTAFETAAKRAASDRVKCQETEHEVQSLREDAVRTKAQLSEAVQKAREIETAMTEARSSKKVMETSLQTISTKYQKVKIAYHSKARKVDELGANVSRLESAVVEKGYQMQRLSSDVKRALMEREEAEKERHKNDNEVIVLKKKMEGLKSTAKEAAEKARMLSSEDEMRIQNLVAENKKEAEGHRGAIEEAQKLKSLLSEREKVMRKFDEELISVKAAYERKELQLIQSQEVALDEARSSSRQEIRLLDDKVDKIDRKRINAEGDARELARELHEERKSRLQLEDHVESLRAALNNQKAMARNAVEGLRRQFTLTPPPTPKHER